MDSTRSTLTGGAREACVSRCGTALACRLRHHADQKCKHETALRLFEGFMKKPIDNDREHAPEQRFLFPPQESKQAAYDP